jgi:hypothetical protein
VGEDWKLGVGTLRKSVDREWANQGADRQVMPTSSSVGERRRVDGAGRFDAGSYILFNS